MAEGLTLQFPLDCTLGDTCYIQQYMDHDPGNGFRDYHCSGLSYDGHKGTDFAVPDRAAMEAGVNVLAAADGRVRGFRDGMPDTGYSPETATIVEGKECGNGVVLVHPGAWETQYCHLKQGSIAIRNDQTVKAGDVLGQLGQSGRAEFPHLHISVRQGGKPVDPFDPDGTVTCNAPGDSTLWQDTPPFLPGGFISVGFNDSLPSYDEVKLGNAAASTLPPNAPALVVYGFSYGTQKDDIVRLEIIGPQGTVISQDTRMKRNHARAYRAIGKRRRGRALWPTGNYQGKATLLRNGEVISVKTTEISVK
jgi:hypothetical protein